MSYRDILVHLDGNTAGSSFLEAAVAFASSQGAHLRGLYVVDIPDIPGYVEANIPREVLENHRKLFFEQAETAESTFQRACENTGLSFEWECVEGDTAHTVVRSARYADLVLLAGGAGVRRDDRTGVADRVVLEGGRPVLIIPPVETAAGTGSRVVVAWKPGKEAARAVHDALPLMTKAKWVKIVSVNPQLSDEAHGELAGAGIAAHLSRHGVPAEPQPITVDSTNPGKGLLTWAAEEQADLIVMGAYGHSRWSELVLGGFTAHVLRNATVPVLMSH